MGFFGKKMSVESRGEQSSGHVLCKKLTPLLWTLLLCFGSLCAGMLFTSSHIPAKQFLGLPYSKTTSRQSIFLGAMPMCTNNRPEPDDQLEEQSSPGSYHVLPEDSELPSSHEDVPAPAPGPSTTTNTTTGSNDDAEANIPLEMSRIMMGLTLPVSVAVMIFWNQQSSTEKTADSQVMNDSLIAAFCSFACTTWGMVLQRYHPVVGRSLNYAGIFLGVLGVCFVMHLSLPEDLQWLAWVIGNITFLLLTYIIGREVWDGRFG